MAVGSLFTNRALNPNDEEEEKKGALDDFDDELTPEEIRKEIFEAVLKRRIFFSDRFEKVERTLLSMNIIPKDHCYCSDEELEFFKGKLFRK